MTARARPRWVRRLRMAWQVFRHKTALDAPLAHVDAQRRQRAAEAQLSHITQELLRRPTPITDSLAKFEALKQAMLELVTEDRAKPMGAEEMSQRLQLALLKIGIGLEDQGT